jgi:arylsulfatase A-like enzyme
MAAHQAEPFFLYLPHTMPGSTKHPFSSEGFRGKSANGDYGDSVEELDWSTGEIMAALKRLKLEENTLVVWTSDNGAARRMPPQGSNAPYSGWGYDTSEGAMRMPCIMRWPGKIPAGAVNDALCSTMDMLPTFASLVEAKLPAQKIDGHDITAILMDAKGTTSPWDDEGFFYYRMEQLQAVRAGDWKLYLPLEGKFANLQRKAEPAKLALYDVRHDVSEEREVSAERPEVVAKLTALAEKARVDLGDVNREGSGQRAAGKVEKALPLLP